MKRIFVYFLITLLAKNISSAMTEAQLKAAAKLVRNSCLPKSKSTSEQLDALKSGNWDTDHNTMCYLHCAMSMYKLLNKDNTLNYETSIAQLEKTLPEARREPTKKSLNECKDAAKTLGDKCVAAFEISKCVYFSNPPNYFLI